MTDTATTYGPALDGSDETSPVTTKASPTEATLISEQQVLFSTAAAVALPPARTHRWSDAVRAVSGALRRMFAASETPRAQKHYPKRHAWLDNAMMAREMDRL
jgi:hypothetical protein